MPKEYVKRDLLQSIDFLGSEALSRLLINIDEQHFSAGDCIYKSGDVAESFYIISDGIVEMKRDAGVEYLRAGDFFGEESLLDMRRHLTEMKAHSSVKVLVIRAKKFLELGDHLNSDAVKKKLNLSLLMKLNHAAVATYNVPEAKNETAAFFVWKQLIGWILSVLIPLLVFEGLGRTSIPLQSNIFVSVLSFVSVLAVFRLVPDYLGMLIAIFILMAGGISPVQTVLSGFSSGGFVLALGFFCLTTVLVGSGAFYKMMLYCLCRIKNSWLVTNLFLFSIGFILSFMVPSLFVRSEIVKSFLLDIARTGNVNDNSKTIASFVFSGFAGSRLITQCVLSGAMTHFVVLGMFLPQYAHDYSWGGWLKAAFVPMVIIVIGYLVSLRLFFKNNENFHYSYQVLREQKEIIGNFNSTDSLSVFCFLVPVLCTMTMQWHGISPENILLFVMIFLIVLDFSGVKHVKNNTRWDLIIFLAALSGVMSAGNAVGLVDWMSVEFSWLVKEMHQHFVRFLLCLAGIVLVLRIIFPKDMVINLLCLVFIPLAQKHAVNPWIIVFVIFTAARIWFLPAQDMDYAVFANDIKSKFAFEDRKIIQAQFVLNVFMILSIVSGLFYWNYLGILVW